MSANLLLNEETFRKLNEEEENRNRKLMEEYDSLLKKQSFLLEGSLFNNDIAHYQSLLQKRCMGDIDEDENKAFNKKREQDKNSPDNCIHIDIPESVDEMGAKGMARFYRSKIKSILNEKHKTEKEYKAKSELLKNTQKQNQKLAEEKEKLLQALTSHKISNNKLENQVETLTLKLQTAEAENASLKKEIEQLRKDLKINSLNVSSVELKLNRALEENDKMRKTLKLTKQDEKDSRDCHRKELADILTTNKALMKQKNEILCAFKKQMQLIDNLKKQKAYLETLKLTQLSENEFIKLLEIHQD